MDRERAPRSSAAVEIQ